MQQLADFDVQLFRQRFDEWKKNHPSSCSDTDSESEPEKDKVDSTDTKMDISANKKSGEVEQISSTERESIDQTENKPKEQKEKVEIKETKQLPKTKAKQPVKKRKVKSTKDGASHPPKKEKRKDSDDTEKDTLESKKAIEDRGSKYKLPGLDSPEKEDGSSDSLMKTPEKTENSSDEPYNTNITVNKSSEKSENHSPICGEIDIDKSELHKNDFTNMNKSSSEIDISSNDEKDMDTDVQSIGFPLRRERSRSLIADTFLSSDTNESNYTSAEQEFLYVRSRTQSVTAETFLAKGNRNSLTIKNEDDLTHSSAEEVTINIYSNSNNKAYSLHEISRGGESSEKSTPPLANSIIENPSITLNVPNEDMGSETDKSFANEEEVGGLETSSTFLKTESQDTTEEIIDKDNCEKIEKTEEIFATKNDSVNAESNKNNESQIAKNVENDMTQIVSQNSDCTVSQTFILKSNKDSKSRSSSEQSVSPPSKDINEISTEDSKMNLSSEISTEDSKMNLSSEISTEDSKMNLSSEIELDSKNQEKLKPEQEVLKESTKNIIEETTQKLNETLSNIAKFEDDIFINIVKNDSDDDTDDTDEDNDDTDKKKDEKGDKKENNDDDGDEDDDDDDDDDEDDDDDDEDDDEEDDEDDDEKVKKKAPSKWDTDYTLKEVRNKLEILEAQLAEDKGKRKNWFKRKDESFQDDADANSVENNDKIKETEETDKVEINEIIPEKPIPIEKVESPLSKEVVNLPVKSQSHDEVLDLYKRKLNSNSSPSKSSFIKFEGVSIQKDKTQSYKTSLGSPIKRFDTNSSPKPYVNEFNSNKSDVTDKTVMSRVLHKKSSSNISPLAIEPPAADTKSRTPLERTSSFGMNKNNFISENLSKPVTNEYNNDTNKINISDLNKDKSLNNANIENSVRIRSRTRETSSSSVEESYQLRRRNSSLTRYRNDEAYEPRRRRDGSLIRSDGISLPRTRDVSLTRKFESFTPQSSSSDTNQPRTRERSSSSTSDTYLTRRRGSGLSLSNSNSDIYQTRRRESSSSCTSDNIQPRTRDSSISISNRSEEALPPIRKSSSTSSDKLQLSLRDLNTPLSNKSDESYQPRRRERNISTSSDTILSRTRDSSITRRNSNDEPYQSRSREVCISTTSDVIKPRTRDTSLSRSEEAYQSRRRERSVSNSAETYQPRTREASLSRSGSLYSIRRRNSNVENNNETIQPISREDLSKTTNNYNSVQRASSFSKTEGLGDRGATSSSNDEAFQARRKNTVIPSRSENFVESGQLRSRQIGRIIKQEGTQIKFRPRSQSVSVETGQLRRRPFGEESRISFARRAFISDEEKANSRSRFQPSSSSSNQGKESNNKMKVETGFIPRRQRGDGIENSSNKNKSANETSRHRRYY